MGLVGEYIPRPQVSYAKAAYRRMGFFGDDSLDISADEVTVQSPEPDISSSFADLSNITVDPVLQDINVSTEDFGNTPIDLGAAVASTDSSGGYWSSIGSGLSSVGSGLASAVASVAGAIINPQVLSSAGNIAASVIKATSTAQQAQLQQQVLQSQLQRTATGAGAAPIRYMTNPATGQQQPYYYNAVTGQYQLARPSGFATPSLFSSAGAMGNYLPYILLGGGLLLVVALSSQHKRT